MNEQFFSKRTYPILAAVENKALSRPLQQYFHEEDAKHSNFQTIVKAMDMGFYGLMLNETTDNIRYLTKPFSDAIVRAHDQMTDPSVWSNVEQGEGIILAPSHVQYLYKVTVNEKGHHQSLMMVFHKEKMLSMFFLEHDQVPIFWASELLMKDTLELYPETFKDITEERRELAVCSMVYARLIATLNFIKYAEIETKYLPPKKKIKETHCRYFNDSKSKITILDSSWFTTIVQSQGFGVRSHFRLQACGPGMKDRKLIYIKDFKKSGYTIKSKKIRNEHQ